MLHFRGGRDAISAKVYPRLEEFYDDLTEAYRAEVNDLAARGCRYLQLDDTNLAYLCDPAIRERTAARGDDPDALVRLYCKLVNDRSAIGQPKDMTISVHLCRGNFKSAWVAQGGYEPVAEILLNEIERSTASSSNRATTSARAISRRCASRRRASRSCSN